MELNSKVAMKSWFKNQVNPTQTIPCFFIHFLIQVFLQEKDQIEQFFSNILFDFDFGFDCQIDK